MPNTPVDNSKNISIRWRWLGLVRHPFPDPPRADNMGSDEINATFVLDPQDALRIRNNNSTVILAPYGGGKTMSRKFFEKEFKQQQDTLVVFVDLRKKKKNENPGSFLLRMVATAVWEVVITRPTQFISLSMPKQGWWWSLLRNHLYDEEQMEVALDRSLNVDTLKQSFEEYGTRYALPFSSNAPFYSILHDIQQNIIDFDFDRLVFLVDNSDHQSEQDLIRLEKSVSPFFEDVGWYSVQGIYWKWFLPDIIANYIFSTEVYKGSHLTIAPIKWTPQEMKELLENRLLWASNNKTGISLHGFSYRDLEAGTKLDEQLVSLSLQHQEVHGAPRTLLKLGNDLVNNLPKLSDSNRTDIDHALIKRKEWVQFLKRIDEYFANQENNRSIKQNDTELPDEEVNSEPAPPLLPPPVLELTNDEKNILRDDIACYFNLPEIKELCSDLNVKFDDLHGDGHKEKIGELVSYMYRHGQLRELVTACEELRPHVTWLIR